jgi:hypothetical protein
MTRSVLIFVVPLFIVACLAENVLPDGTSAQPSDLVSFRNDVVPILTKTGCNSGPCHGAAAGKNGFKLSLRGHDPETDYAVLTRQSLGRRISRLVPSHSLILLKPTGTIPHGGARRFLIDSVEYQILADWIAQGAVGPASTDPEILEIIINPGLTMKEEIGARFRLEVTATYSDGASGEVTRWAKYETTNGGVARVDDIGEVTITGPGEAAITVWYSSKVGFARVAVPFPTAVDSHGLEDLPTANYIDGNIFRKLRQLRVQPSKVCSDEVFIRRLYLTTMGILPTLSELGEFLEDDSRNKRTILIDRVLQRLEFTDYWTYKWSDLLIVDPSSKNSSISPPAVRAYYKWIRDSVASNKPWDSFVRELVTATGNTLVNGAANYWAIHQNPKDITENLALTFLGTSMTCARCHNHPLEKWTQDQYYGLANLVTRVAVKTGDLPGEAYVVNRHTGDINHPRLNRPMAPEPLDGNPMALDSTLDRREHLADWLTSADNPYFARATVNRIWATLMGRGLVHPVDDLRATNPSSHPDLMIALTQDFISSGFDVRHLIRTILLSTTYQLSSETNSSNQNDNSLYSHHLTRRLPAEVVLDIMSQVTGVPEEFAGYPEGTRALQLRDTQVESYFLDAFGRPPRTTPNSSERTDSANLSQVLHLINGDTLNRKLTRRGSRVDQMVDQAGQSGFLEQLYRTLFSRLPTPAEESRLEEYLGADPARDQMEDVLWAMLTSREFLFTR